MNTITIQPPKGLSLKKAKIALKNLNFTIIEEKDDSKMTKEEFYDKIENGLREYKDGKTKEFETFKDFQNYISK